MKYLISLFKSNWGKWIDISTGAVNEHRYLLQARRHKNGMVQFRVEKSPGAWMCEKPSIEDLKRVKYYNVTDIKLY